MITLEEAFIISSIFFLLAVPAIIRLVMRYFAEKAIGKEIKLPGCLGGQYAYMMFRKN